MSRGGAKSAIVGEQALAIGGESRYSARVPSRGCARVGLGGARILGGKTREEG
jgi:hypothetical protein